MSKLKRVFTIIMCILLTLPMCLVSKPNNVYAESSNTLNTKDYENVELLRKASSGNIVSDYVDVSNCDYVILTLVASTTSIYNVSMRYTSINGGLQDIMGMTIPYFIKNGADATGTNIATVNNVTNSTVTATYDVRNISKVRFYGSGKSTTGSNSAGTTWTTEPSYIITGLVPKKPVFSGDLASGNLTRPCAYIVFV